VQLRAGVSECVKPASRIKPVVGLRRLDADVSKMRNRTASDHECMLSAFGTRGLFCELSLASALQNSRLAQGPLLTCEWEHRRL
jgi:hypothetical protein